MLKPTGSLYLHCDPTASHYLKIAAGCGIWAAAISRSEIIVEAEQNAHNDRPFDWSSDLTTRSCCIPTFEMTMFGTIHTETVYAGHMLRSSLSRNGVGGYRDQLLRKRSDRIRH